MINHDIEFYPHANGLEFVGGEPALHDIVGVVDPNYSESPKRAHSFPKICSHLSLEW